MARAQQARYQAGGGEVMSNAEIAARIADIMIDLDLSGDVEFAVDALGTLLQQLGGKPPVDHFPDLAEAIGGSYVRD